MLNNKDTTTYCVIDYETYSELPLPDVGSYEYARHPSTEILCVAWRVGSRAELPTAKTLTWDMRTETNENKCNFAPLLRTLRDPTIILVAHNALFEQMITRYVFAEKVMSSIPYLKEIPVSRWQCTASFAAACALPRKLEGACSALGLTAQKDMEGNRLIKKWCKPKKPSKKNPNTRHDDPAEFARIVEYCANDITAQTGLFLRLPPLNALEKKVWQLDQEINMRGFRVDRPLVRKTLKMIDQELTHLTARTEELTDYQLQSTNQRVAMLDWLTTQGVGLPDLKAKTVQDALTENLASGDAKELLEIRQAVSKTSTAKYEAFELRSRTNGRVRDILMYHGAGPGRWSGRGIQPQNFPRGTIKNTIQACEIMATGDLELVRQIYGNPMEVFASCLRGQIIAPKGKTLDVCDYSGVEARGVFWLADHQEGIKAFNEGRDMYSELAVDIYRKPLKQILKDSIERFVGKQATLGCGYQMGWKKFISTCANFGQAIDEATARAAVTAYRTKHAPVVKLWSNIQMAAMAAIRNPGKRYCINKTKWFVKDSFLWCELPSGRRIAYYQPTISFEMTEWKEKRPVIKHWGVDSLTKRWVQQKVYGGLLVENVVQGICRDLMAEAMLRIEATGHWQIILTVHDELVAERVKDQESYAEFERLMCVLPEWAKRFPIKAEGWTGERYRK